MDREEGALDSRARRVVSSFTSSIDESGAITLRARHGSKLRLPQPHVARFGALLACETGALAQLCEAPYGSLESIIARFVSDCDQALTLPQGALPQRHVFLAGDALSGEVLSAHAKRVVDTPKSFLVAALGGVEVHLDESEQANQVRDAALGKSCDAIVISHASPWTGVPFFASTDARWYELFASIHRSLTRAAVHEDAMARWVALLRGARQQAPLAAASGAVLRAVIAGLLGLDVPCDLGEGTEPPSWDPLLGLPPPAAPTVRAFGAVRTGLALVWAKACHDTFLLGQMLGVRDMPLAEAEWIELALRSRA